MIFYLDFCTKFTVVYVYWPTIREPQLIWQNANIRLCTYPLLTSAQQLDAYYFETLCLQHTLARLSLIIVRLQIELLDLMEKNGFLCKCIIIMLPTVVFPLSVSFLKSVGIQYCAVISVDKNLFSMAHCGSRRSRNLKQRLA